MGFLQYMINTKIIFFVRMYGHAGGDKTNYSNREAEFASPSLVHHAATIECIYIH